MPSIVVVKESLLNRQLFRATQNYKADADYVCVTNET